MAITFPYTLTNGNTADADEVMSNFNEIKNNLDPDTVEDASADTTAMQSTADPYPASAESLATDLRGEIKRLRYAVKQLMQTSQWYIHPDLVSKTTTYTATLNDKTILCDASGGAWTLTLPAASGNTDKEYIIKKTDSSANAVTIDGNGSETIDGATTKALSIQYESLRIVCDGTNWVIGSNFNKSDSGTYTPSATGVTNIDTVTGVKGFYVRIGDTVYVSGKITVDATAAAYTNFRVDLPIASALVSSDDLAGSGSEWRANTSGAAVSINGDAPNDEAEFRYIATSVGNTQVTFTFSYAVI